MAKYPEKFIEEFDASTAHYQFDELALDTSGHISSNHVFKFLKFRKSSNQDNLLLAEYSKGDS